MKFIIKTDKGFICEAKACGYYEKSNNEFYRVETGKWFNTQDEIEATKYSSFVGNRINEIIERIKFGYEDIREILIKIIGD